MKQIVRIIFFCTTVFYACQQPGVDIAPAGSDGALRAAAKPTKCDDALEVKIKSSFKDFDRLYLFQAMYVGRNGKDSAVAKSVYQDVQNGSELEFEGLAFNKTVRLRLYENDQDLSKFVSSGTFSSCGKGSAEFDLRTYKMSVPATLITFQVAFPCSDVDQRKLPASVPVEFRQTGTTTWLPLKTLTSKDIKKNTLQTTSYRLVKGKTYDVRLAVYGTYLSQNATLLNKDTWEVPVKTTLFCK